MPSFYVVREPEPLIPAYNDIIYQLDSVNKTKPNFRYLIDVYDETGSTLLKRYRVAPRPGDGYGELNLSSFAQSNVTYDAVLPWINGAATPTNSQFNYAMKYGEEFTETWAFYDYGYYVDPNPVPLYEGYVNLLGTTPHSYSVNDVITISALSGAYNPELEGTFTIVAVPSSTIVTIDLSYFSLSNPGPVTSGITIVADNKRVEFPNLATSELVCAFNGAFNWYDYINYTYNDYRTDSVTNSQRLLTNFNKVKGEYYMSPNALLQVVYNYYLPGVTSQVNNVVYQNNLGDLFISDAISTSTGVIPEPFLRMVQVGPGDNNATNLVSGTAPLVRNGVDYYDFWLCDGDPANIITQIYRVYIDWRCDINRITLTFLDRLGSFATFDFNLRERETIVSDKKTFNRTLDYDNSSGVFDGEVVYNSTLERSWELNTNWMTEAMNTYFEELITSPICIMIINGEPLPVVVQEKNYEIVKRRNKNLIRKTITVKSAFGEKINI
jgi:hypothetical protein